jgi:hypothetical protein
VAFCSPFASTEPKQGKKAARRVEETEPYRIINNELKFIIISAGSSLFSRIVGKLILIMNP